MFLSRAGMGPFSEHVSLSVEPRHVYQHSVLGPELPVPVGPRFRTFVWSVPTIGPFGFGTRIPVSDNSEQIVLREDT